MRTKYSVCLLIILSILWSSLHGQYLEIPLKKIKADEVPASVLNKIHNSYDDQSIKSIKVLSAQDYLSKWYVSGTHDILEKDSLYYLISFKGDERKFKAILNTRGNLIHFRKHCKNKNLPDPVLEAVAVDFPDWKTRKLSEIALKSTDGDVDYYIIRIQRYQPKKVLMYDASGKLLKERSFFMES